MPSPTMTPARRPPRLKRMLLRALAGASVALVLSGCTLGAGDSTGGDSTGHTAGAAYSHQEATNAIAELPGITAAEVSTSTEGTPNQVRLQVTVVTAAGYSGNPADLLDFALGQAWSSTDAKPTTTVRVDLAVEGSDLDLVALAAKIGLTGTVDADNPYDSSVRIRVDEVAAAYGQWPGATPPAPASLAGVAP
jgi:hypothetical protein